MEKKMTTAEIISNINSNGGFNNFRNWSRKEVAGWVKANYPCSKYVAQHVAEHIA